MKLMPIKALISLPYFVPLFLVVGSILPSLISFTLTALRPGYNLPRPLLA
jgi:hypothetical protein